MVVCISISYRFDRTTQVGPPSRPGVGRVASSTTADRYDQENTGSCNGCRLVRGLPPRVCERSDGRGISTGTCSIQSRATVMTIDIRTPALTRGKAFTRCALGLFPASATLVTFAAPSSPVAPQPDQPAGNSYSYLWITGSTFHPVETANTYSYPGGGCLSKAGGSSPLLHET